MKKLVLITFALFVIAIGGMGIHRMLLPPSPVLIPTASYPRIGSEQAKIELIIFEDFLCRACRFFNQEVQPRLLTTYVDTGVVRIIAIPLAFSDESKVLANAALEVFDQIPDQFFPFVRELFAEIPENEKAVTELAKKMPGLNMDIFENSLRTGRYNEELERNKALAGRIMKNKVHVPAIFLNGQLAKGITFHDISEQIKELQ